MIDMDLLYSDTEMQLRAAVRGQLEVACEHAAVQAMYDGDRSIVKPLWAAVGQGLGVAGLLIPERWGGAGASAREVAVVLEELGRAVAPVPFLTSSVIATAVLSGSDDTLLADLADGTSIAALAVPFCLGPDAAPPLVNVDAGGCLVGHVTSVAGALEADTLLVAAADDNGIGLYAAASIDSTVSPVVSLDMSRQLADIEFDRVPARRVRADGLDAVRHGMQVGAALLASEQLGLAQWCLATTIDHLQRRRQFGRQLGSFQALKHRVAYLYSRIEMACAVARYAAGAVAATSDDAGVAASVAQSYCGEIAVLAAEEALQLHGGIGMTWDHPVHLYLKRAKADYSGLGSPGRHNELLARLVDLPQTSQELEVASPPKLFSR